MESRDYDNLDHSSRTSKLVTAAIILEVMAILFVALRMFTRIYLTGAFGYDDVLMFIASVFTIGVSVTTCLAAVWGCGRHAWDVSAEDITLFGKATFANSLVYPLALMFIKLSILCFYKRIAVSVKLHRAVTAMMALVVGHAIAFSFSVLFQCLPIKTVWEGPAATNFTCINTIALYYANGALNLSSDVVTLLMPIPLLWNARLTGRQKLSMFGIFSLGLLTCAAGAIRIYYLPLTEKKLLDATWNLADCLKWQAVEIDVGMICACVPALKPLLSRVAPSVFGSYNEGGSHTVSTSGRTRKYKTKTKTKTKTRTIGQPNGMSALEFAQDAMDTNASTSRFALGQSSAGKESAGFAIREEDEDQIFKLQVMKRTEVTVSVEDEPEDPETGPYFVQGRTGGEYDLEEGRQ